MPKDKKKRKDSSDSDLSDSENSAEEKKPPPKKQKTSAKSKSDEEPQWQLSADKIVKIREFKGKLYIDIRQYYNGPSGDLLPTKKGISLTPENYQKFKKLISEIDEKLAKF